MRKYEKKETGTLTELYCNRCGKKLHVENGIAMEGVHSLGILLQKRYTAPSI